MASALEGYVQVGRTRLRCPSRTMPRAVLLTSSLMMLDSLPPMPVLALLSALLRVSLAFTSTGMKPSSLLQIPQSLRIQFDFIANNFSSKYFRLFFNIRTYALFVQPRQIGWVTQVQERALSSAWKRGGLTWPQL